MKHLTECLNQGCGWLKVANLFAGVLDGEIEIGGCDV